MIRSTTDGILVHVHVVLRASRAGTGGVRQDALVVRLNSAPVDGAANAELVEVVAKALAVPRRAVRIVSGERSRLKRLAVAGITIADARTKLGL